jgi:hypothetical protein
MKIKLEFSEPCPNPETYLSESLLATHKVTKRAGISRDGLTYFYTLIVEPAVDTACPDTLSMKKAKSGNV